MHDLNTIKYVILSLVKVTNLILQLVKHVIVIPSHPQSLGLASKDKYSVGTLKHWCIKKRLL